MNLSPKQIKQEAALRIATTPGDHKKLTLIYGGIALGASLLSVLINFVISLMVENTGGLASLGTRAILQSVSAVADVAISILLPLWTIGLTRTMLRLSRQERVYPQDLTQGFSRWGVFLRLTILQALMYIAVAYVVGQFAMIFFTMTPLSDSAMNLLARYSDETALMNALTTDTSYALALLKALAPLMIIWFVVMAGIFLYMGYGMRLSLYRILDEDCSRARVALRDSKRMIQGKRWTLFRLDLSFWWYYLLLFLLSALLYLPLVLEGRIPLSYDVMNLIVTLVHAGLTLLLYQKFLLQLEVSYALFYDTLYEEYKNPPVQAPQFYWQQQ